MSVHITKREFKQLVFEAGQQPAAWLRSAERLRDAAEVILKHELPAEIAYKIAKEEAITDAHGNDASSAYIKAIPPNYPPAQLLYAYAVENVLKGLIVLKRPDLIQERKLDDELDNHDLNELAKKADVTVDGQHERPVLEALSQLSIWAGRYPVALKLDFVDVATLNPNQWLDYGSAHPIMRTFFERAYKELESRLPQQSFEPQHFSRFEKLLVFR
jgi:hypothetical protein